MDLCTLTAELTTRGLSPTVAGGKLAIAGPVERLSPALKAGLAAHRETLRAMLGMTLDALPPENAGGIPDIAWADSPEAEASIRRFNPDRCPQCDADLRKDGNVVYRTDEKGDLLERCVPCGATWPWGEPERLLAASGKREVLAEFKREVAEAKAEPACPF